MASMRTTFVLLFALMAVNYLDRTVVATMFGPLKAEWGLSDRALGSLASIVSVMIAVCAIPLSMVADRWSRIGSLVGMALVWSGATIGAAFTTSYGGLIAMRGLVGVGEAAFGATSAALLAGLFPRERRSSILGAFFLATILGSLGGMLLGGLVVGRWGWRAGFVAAGLPGVVLAAALLLLRRPEWDGAALTSAKRAGDAAAPRALLLLLQTRTLVVTCIGAGLQLLPAAVIFAWMPTYLEREQGFSGQTAAVLTAAIILMSGIGMAVWGNLADRRQRSHPCGRLQVSIVGALVAGASLTPAFMLDVPGWVQAALLAVGAFAAASSVGPMNAVAIDTAPSRMRATAAAIGATIPNLLGFALGPFLAGAVSDHFGLPTALALTSLLCFPAAGAFLMASRTYRADVLAIEE